MKNSILVRRDFIDIVMELIKMEQKVVKCIKNNIAYCPYEQEYVPLVKFNRDMIADTES